ncbi:MAG: XRE family transcriptional regulator [Candidatus Riflebacteria bacterium HGW-Riflebacteria-1]|nr:MAG: XRE family transcriptional regulator [Candidatus Riflebacteria bacterium HGW-Riflebacteria-1]
MAICFQVPADKLEDIKRIIVCLGGQEASQTGENWRDSFPERHPGVVLRGLRNRDNLTQSELAKKTGMLQSHISEMENGARTIGKTIAKKFAQVFNTEYKIFL